MIRKKIMCLALSLAFGVMSPQAQAIGNSTQILAKTDSTISRTCNLLHWRSEPCSIVSYHYYAKYSEPFNIHIAFTKSLLLSNRNGHRTLFSAR
ncbi:MAG: hypothetical protein LBD98_03720 [Endomicrobium sp.]|jgi:hypothetical protein|nr:hypothetical protein [Endomicrobium sp.]